MQTLQNSRYSSTRISSGVQKESFNDLMLLVWPTVIIDSLPQTTIGSVKYVPQENAVIWSIKQFPVSVDSNNSQ